VRYSSVLLAEGAAYSFLAFQHGDFVLHGWTNRRGTFHKLFLGLCIAGSCSTVKGFAAEPLRVNSPPPGPKVFAAPQLLRRPEKLKSCQK
jgi:hypothetical protein